MKFIFIFFITFLIFITPLLFFKPFLEEDYPSYKNQRIKVGKRLNPNPDSVILGSSHANSLDKHLLKKISGKKIAKLNRGGQDLFETIYIIKSVNNKIINQVFVITLSPFTFHYDNHAFIKKGKRTRREKRIELYSVFNNYTNFINWDLSNLLLSFFHPVVTPDHLKTSLPFEKLQSLFNFKDRKRKRKRKHTKNKRGATHECYPTEKEKELDAHAVRRVKRVYKNLIPNMQKNADYVIEKRSFEKFYRLCSSLEGESTFVLFTPPYWPGYYDRIPDDIKMFMEDSADRLSKLSNVHYIDFNKYESFTSQPCLFVNSDHLNRKGKKQFTIFFYERLIDIGIGF